MVVQLKVFFFVKEIELLIIKCTDLKRVHQWVFAMVYTGISAKRGNRRTPITSCPTPSHLWEAPAVVLRPLVVCTPVGLTPEAGAPASWWVSCSPPEAQASVWHLLQRCGDLSSELLGQGDPTLSWGGSCFLNY